MHTKVLLEYFKFIAKKTLPYFKSQTQTKNITEDIVDSLINCHTHVTRILHTCHTVCHAHFTIYYTHVKHFSHTSHIHVKHFSHTSHIHVTYMSHTFHIHVTYMSQAFRTHDTSISHTFHTHFTHMSRICHKHDSIEQKDKPSTK